jgi:hypothetical protein
MSGRIAAVSALVLGAVLVPARSASSAAKMAAGQAAINGFLGGRDGVLAFVDNEDGGKIKWVDLGDSGLAIHDVSADTGCSNPIPHKDGARLVYMRAGRVYTRRLSAGSAVEIASVGTLRSGGCAFWYAEGGADYRYGRSFDRSRFQEQEAVLRKMLKRSNRIKRLCVDRHGIGMNLAENLHAEFHSRVEGIALVGQTKETLAVDLHIVFENEEISIPRDRELLSQIHSVKKTATDAGYSRYDTEKNERHHADRMWSLALAVHAAGVARVRKRKRSPVTVKII